MVLVLYGLHNGYCIWFTNDFSDKFLGVCSWSFLYLSADLNYTMGSRVAPFLCIKNYNYNRTCRIQGIWPRWPHHDGNAILQQCISLCGHKTLRAWPIIIGIALPQFYCFFLSFEDLHVVFHCTIIGVECVVTQESCWRVFYDILWWLLWWSERNQSQLAR